MKKTCTVDEQLRIEEQLKQCTLTEHAVFNFIMKLKQRFPTVEPSQEYIASQVGITRAYCNRALKKFKSIGILLVEYRHRKTCVYNIAPIVYADGFKHRLMKFFSALKVLPAFLSLSLLCSSLYTPVRIPVLRGINKPVLKGRRMEALIPEHVRAIKSLELTIHGQVKLSGFPAEAIQDAERIMQNSKNIKDPFAWFFRMCRNYCYREKLEPDWSYVDFLKKKLQIDENSPRTVTDYIYRDRYLKQHHPELAHNEKQVPSYAKKVSTVTKPVEAPKPKPTPRDVLESRRRTEERVLMTELQVNEEMLFRECTMKLALWRLSEEEKHELIHTIMSLTTIDPEATKTFTCSLPFCFKEPSPSVSVEGNSHPDCHHDNEIVRLDSQQSGVTNQPKKIYSYEELCAMADVGMKSIGSVIEGIPAFSMIKENASSLEERKREDLKRE